MDISKYIEDCYSQIPSLKRYEFPWDIPINLKAIIEEYIGQLPVSDFKIENNIAIHHSAMIEENVVIKGFTIIGKDCIVKSGAYLRDGVLLGDSVSIGANCEIKQSVIFDQTRIAHLNYVGNSLIGKDVNMEAGSILANHFNERKNREIHVLFEGQVINTKNTKFGSLLGDGTRIGANAVLNPGSILEKGSIVGRLTHLDQMKL